MIRLIFIIQMVLLVSACSHIPETIRNAPQPNVQLLDVQKDFMKYQDKMVRWGGAVIDVENKENETILQMMAYPLRDRGYPDLTEEAQGRFIVKANKFLDPAIYTKNSELSIFGQLVDERELLVGQKSLKLPAVELQQLYLWPKYRQRRYGGYCGYSAYYGRYRYDRYGYRRLYYKPRGYY